MFLMFMCLHKSVYTDVRASVLPKAYSSRKKTRRSLKTVRSPEDAPSRPGLVPAGWID